MNPPQPRKLLACTLVGLTLVTGLRFHLSSQTRNSMSLEQTKQALGGGMGQPRAGNSPERHEKTRTAA